MQTIEIPAPRRFLPPVTVPPTEEIPSVILSAGAGRLHFVETANALVGAGLPTSLILGVIPTKRLEAAYNFAGRLIGRNELSRRLKVRTEGCLLPEGNVHSCAVAESLIYGAMALSRWRLFPNGLGQAITWRIFGSHSQKFLGRHHIFHVRSGAGQGGAIRRAKKLGMKVIVDHSIAHPAHIERALSGLKVGDAITSRDRFWRTVLQDCAEADVLLVNSHFVKETFVAQGFAAEKIRVAYLGVRDDFLSLKNHYNVGAVPRLLFTGAFGYRKGADVLIETIRCLERRGVACELHVAGDASECGGLARAYEGASKIVLHGSLPQENLKRLIADSDLYLFPTRAEGCAKSAMEAMAAGLPVVTTRACGLPGQVGKHHIQISLDDAQRTAAVIVEALQADAQREKIGRAGAALIASCYRWSDYGRTLAEIYRDMT